jgi:hypothetical protein
MISVLDQIIVKADYIFDMLWVFISQDMEYALCVLNVCGNQIPVPLDLQVPIDIY